MKIFIASDIHGSAVYCKKLLAAFDKEKCDRILLLGDILYHGPRNDLPDGYNPKAVIEMLNKVADKVTSVRGNCDSEVDQMVLNFPILSDYCMFFYNDITVFTTHGHIFGLDNFPKLKKNDVLLCGHTHVTGVKELDNGVVYINPGSVSIPKENTERGYVVFEDGMFYFKDLEGNLLSQYKL